MENKVYLARTDALNDEKVFARLYNAVSEERRRKADRFVQKRDKMLSIAAEILLKRALFDCGIDDFSLRYGENGKPYLENMATNISITHTNEYVAVILHEEEEVGIDIECQDRDFSAVEKKALSEDEIDDLDEDRKNEQLAIYWCAKEAIFKRVSAFRVDFAEQIEVEKFRPRGEGELEATFIHKDGYEEEFELEYMTFDRHVLVWVVG